MQHFDYFVIGGGSGGVASARRAAQHGAKVGIAEFRRWGGTCVNAGCVPKKIMYCAAAVGNMLRHDATHFGYDGAGAAKLNWKELKSRRETHIRRLNDIFSRNLEADNVKKFEAFASFKGYVNDGVQISLSNPDGETVVSAKHVLIAVGGKPNPLNVPGGEHCISSDGFFQLEELPKRSCVIGAGYIAVELASMLQGLGSEVTLVCRGDHPLRKFDEMIGPRVMEEMKKEGVTFITNATTKRIEKKNGGQKVVVVEVKDKDTVEKSFDCVIAAIGRSPETEKLNLNLVNIKTNEKNQIAVDEYQNTTGTNIYAVGDVIGKVELTPMAIAAGRLLADRLFGNKPEAKADYTNVPTVVFSHPTVGTVGLTEAEAKEKYTPDKIKVFTTNMCNLYYACHQGVDKPKTTMKVIVLLPSNKVLGIHIIGMGADEMLQGFAVALKMGATKADLDSCVAIHPTAAEELVTLPPWNPVFLL